MFKVNVDGKESLNATPRGEVVIDVHGTEAAVELVKEPGNIRILIKYPEARSATVFIDSQATVTVPLREPEAPIGPEPKAESALDADALSRAAEGTKPAKTGKGRKPAEV